MTSGRRHTNPLLTVDSFLVEVDGKGAGFALSLGERLQFFTCDPRLQALDGRRYGGIEEIRRDVGALCRSALLPPAA